LRRFGALDVFGRQRITIGVLAPRTEVAMTIPPVSQDPTSPPAPEPRPGAVAAVVWTQALTAVVLVLTAVGFLVVKETVRGEAERLMHHDITGDFEIASGEIDWVVQGSFTMMAGFYVMLAAGYALLAVFNSRGAPTARLLTFIMSGAALGCCMPASLFTRLNDDFFAHRSLLPQDSGGMDYSDAANEWIVAATPQWVTLLDWLAVLLLVGGAFMLIVLLNLPAAKRYFRDR
jgi:hypothetical protein